MTDEITLWMFLVGPFVGMALGASLAKSYPPELVILVGGIIALTFMVIEGIRSWKYD